MKDIKEFIYESSSSDFFKNVEDIFLKNGDGIYVVYYSRISRDEPLIYIVKDGKFDVDKELCKKIKTGEINDKSFSLTSWDEDSYYHSPGLRKSLETIRKEYEGFKVYMYDKMYSRFAEKEIKLNKIDRMQKQYDIDEIISD